MQARHRRVLRFIPRASSYSAVDELAAGLLAAGGDFGVEGVAALHLGEPGRALAPQVLFARGGSPRTPFDAEDAAADRPALRHAIRQGGPFILSALAAERPRLHGEEPPGRPSADAFYVPVLAARGAIGAMVLAAPKRLVLGPIDRDLLTAAATLSFLRMRELLPSDLRPAPVLTGRERQCLAWAAEGKSDWAIGEILGLSPTTVHMHIENARRKLGGGTRFQTALEAWRHGQLMA